MKKFTKSLRFLANTSVIWVGSGLMNGAELHAMGILRQSDAYKLGNYLITGALNPINSGQGLSSAVATSCGSTCSVQGSQLSKSRDNGKKALDDAKSALQSVPSQCMSSAAGGGNAQATGPGRKVFDEEFSPTALGGSADKSAHGKADGATEDGQEQDMKYHKVPLKAADPNAKFVAVDPEAMPFAIHANDDNAGCMRYKFKDHSEIATAPIWDGAVGHAKRGLPPMELSPGAFLAGGIQHVTSNSVPGKPVIEWVEYVPCGSQGGGSNESSSPQSLAKQIDTKDANKAGGEEKEAQSLEKATAQLKQASTKVQAAAARHPECGQVSAKLTLASTKTQAAGTNLKKTIKQVVAEAKSCKMGNLMASDFVQGVSTKLAAATQALMSSTGNSSNLKGILDRLYGQGDDSTASGSLVQACQGQAVAMNLSGQFQKTAAMFPNMQKNNDFMIEQLNSTKGVISWFKRAILPEAHAMDACSDSNPTAMTRLKCVDEMDPRFHAFLNSIPGGPMALFSRLEAQYGLTIESFMNDHPPGPEQVLTWITSTQPELRPRIAQIYEGKGSDLGLAFAEVSKEQAKSPVQFGLHAEQNSGFLYFKKEGGVKTNLKNEGVSERKYGLAH